MSFYMAYILTCTDVTNQLINNGSVPFNCASKACQWGNAPECDTAILSVINYAYINCNISKDIKNTTLPTILFGKWMKVRS